MKPSELITLLAAFIPARLPVLITGKPGIGKSDLVHQAAKRAGADVILSHPGVEDPTTPGGFPWLEKGAKEARFVPFGPAARAQTATTPTVWFLDDFGQAPPAVQANYMQWLLARECNGQKLSEFVTFVVATNRRTDRAGVTGVLEPVKSRFAAIVELEPDLDEWCQWALQQPWMAPELVAFLRFKPELLCAFNPTADLTNSPLPRTWAAVAKILQVGLPRAVEHAALVGAIGEGAAVEFRAFRELLRELPNIDAILVNPQNASIPRSPAVLYAVVTALAVRTTEQNFGRAAQYAERLADAGHGEFAALYMRDALRRTPEVGQTPAFVRVSSGPLGQLMTGTLAA